jgi:hypothetical protein
MNERVVSQHIQDCFVLLAITDPKFLATCRRCIKPAYFGSTITENIITLCYNYYDQFDTCPGNHFSDEVAKFLRDEDPDKAELYLAYLEKVNDLDTPNQMYVLDCMNKFVKARVYSEAAIKFVEETEKGDFEAADSVIMKAVREGVKLDDVGIRYFDVGIPTYHLTIQGEELFNLGVEVLGDRVMLKRKEVICILGGHKGKKSWFVEHLGTQACFAGLKVLHITHEMTAEQCEMRYDMTFAGVVSRDYYKEVCIATIDLEGNVTNREIRECDTIANIPKVMQGRRKMARFGGELIIKKYPMGSCSIGELERYLDYLEVFEHFIPDVVINDYPDIMKLPLGDQVAQRDRINRIYIDHKRIADERNLLMLVVSQTNRSGLEKAQPSRKDFAEDIRKLGNVDLVIALGQTREMAEEERMKLFIMAGRSDEDNFSCMIDQCIRIGRPVVNSWIPPREDEDDENNG